MDDSVRLNKIKGLEAIKAEAIRRAEKGEDAFQVRSFIDEAQKELAYENPDADAMKKALNATLAYKKSVQTGGL